MVEVQQNRECLLDGGCEVQSSFITKCFQINQGVILDGQVAEEEKKFGKANNISCQEQRIGNSVIRNSLTESDGWLKLALETLVYRGGGVKISGIRYMAVGNTANMFQSFFWISVGTKRVDSIVDEENIGI